MKSLIFLDDERNLEDVIWISYPDYKIVHTVRNIADFLFIVTGVDNLENYDFSFDHDIQDFSSDVEHTGYDCVKCLCEYAMDNDLNLSKSVFYYHTQNLVGKKNMESYMNSFLKATQG